MSSSRYYKMFLNEYITMIGTFTVDRYMIGTQDELVMMYMYYLAATMHACIDVTHKTGMRSISTRYKINSVLGFNWLCVLTIF